MPGSNDESRPRRLSRSKKAGVWRRSNGRHVAVVYRGEATIFAGTWATWEEAAIARDRAVLHLGLDQPLNFPTRSRRKGGSSPDALTREFHFARKQQSDAHAKYRGASRGISRLWDATLKLHGRNALSLGKWATARLAAKAHDRAALHYGLPSRSLVSTKSVRSAAPKRRPSTHRWLRVTMTPATETRSRAHAAISDSPTPAFLALWGSRGGTDGPRAAPSA